jgi:hypothetical protein
VIFLVNRVCCLVYVYLFTMLCHEFICSEEVSVGTLHSEDLFFCCCCFYYDSFKLQDDLPVLTI